eukprot:6478109-Amphidinium_carterae.1
MKLAIRDGKLDPSFKAWKSSCDAVRPTIVLETLIRNMIQRDPHKRLSSAEVLENQFWFQLSRPGVYSGAPSFRPMLQGAIRSGAFAVPRRNKDESKDATDFLLSELRRKSLGRKSLSSSNAPGSSKTSASALFAISGGAALMKDVTDLAFAGSRSSGGAA